MANNRIIGGPQRNPAIVHGSTEHQCVECGSAVMLTPSGVKKMKEMVLDPCCLRCFVKAAVASAEPIELRMPTAADILSDTAGENRN